MSGLKISYSNAIFYLKLLLFFLGLFAILLIFWSAKKIEPSTEIPFAKDVNFASLNDGLTEPLYSSITNSGDELQIKAQQIVATERKDTALIKSASVKIFSKNRPGVFLSSDKALLNKNEKNLIFIDNVLFKEKCTHPSNKNRKQRLSQWLSETKPLYEKAPQRYGIGETIF